MVYYSSQITLHCVQTRQLVTGLNSQQAAAEGLHQHHQSPDQEALEWATGREREGGGQRESCEMQV